MARRWDDACPYCGMKYSQLRTGLTFGAVRTQFWSASPDPEHWVNKRRRTVLGRWREIKMNMWSEHLHWCHEAAKMEEGKHDISVKSW